MKLSAVVRDVVGASGPAGDGHTAAFEGVRLPEMACHA